MLNLEPVRIGREFQWTCCLDDTIATVAKYYRIEYRFAYPETWNFLYTPWSENEYLKFSDRIGTENVKERYGFVEKYHRIKMNRCETEDVCEILRAVREELSAKRPVSIRMDSYCLPWDALYQRGHTNHVCMPVEVNESLGYIKVIDPFNMLVDLQFPISLLQEASGFYITYAVDREQNSSFDRRGVFGEIIGNLLRGKDNKNAFHRMRTFAEDFLRYFDPAVELAESCGQFAWRPLHYSMIDMAFGRSLFHITMKYMAEADESAEMDELTVCFRRMISKWNIVIAMLQRTFRMQDKALPPSERRAFSTDSGRVIRSVYKLLAEEADYEEKTAERLLDILKSPGKTHPVYGRKNTQGGGKTEGSGCVCLDLKQHFNNKAFDSMEPCHGADFTGHGEFILADGFPEQTLWKTGDMAFQLAEVRKPEEDNISCTGQVVAFEPVRCGKISFLTAAEWGNYFEPVRLMNTGGEELEINLGVSDFAFATRYGEKTVWVGKSAGMSDGKVQIMQQEAKLFLVTCDLGGICEISGIRLPDCSNIHIFAITLHGGEEHDH